MTKEVQKWADEAMFKAEPLSAEDGITVHLLAGTPDPLGAVSAMSKMYKGEVVRNTADVTDDERREYLEQILKTKLKAPLEAVKVHFMVEGVTRSFTHQMVRQRTAVYAQESLRFAVKEDMGDGVRRPPSLEGTVSHDEWKEKHSGYTGWDTQQQMREEWDNVVARIDEGYNRLINWGMPAEDARGLLPHNILTRLNYVTDLRALQDHAGNRLCTQAQFEWRMFFSKLVEEMRDYCSHSGHNDASGHPWEHGKKCDNWQWREIAGIFRPVCYLTGKCEFMANFDRACSIRERVEANHHIGRPSSEWGNDYMSADHGDYIHGVDDPSDNKVYIGAIEPAEWLLDPAAARRS